VQVKLCSGCLLWVGIKYKPIWREVVLLGKKTDVEEKRKTPS
jgi:hypothetical protein